MTFTVDMSELRGCGDKLHRETVRGLERAVRVALEAGERRAIATAPERTGDLKRSIKASGVRVQTNAVTGRLVIGIKYAIHVVGGTRAHVIVPRRAKALHWTAGGASFFAKRVNHPGTQPNPFFLGACRVVSVVLDAGADRAAEDACRAVMR